MRKENELVISSISGVKISSETWLRWLSKQQIRKIDFYGCVPAYDPFLYREGKNRFEKLRIWKELLVKRGLELFSYTPEMRGYPLNLCDTNEEIRMFTEEYCEHAIEDAAFLETGFIRLETGYSYLGQSWETAFAQPLKSMEPLIQKAEKEKICILTGPKREDMTNVINDCESAYRLLERFDSDYLKLFLPADQIFQYEEDIAWYGNLFEGRLQALGINADVETVVQSLEMLESSSRIVGQMPVIIELNGINLRIVIWIL